MDDLLLEFLTETRESLTKLDIELMMLARNPGDDGSIHSVLRLVHTIKGTCGFLALPRLEAVAHATESVLAAIRDGALAPTASTVSPVLAAIDRIKQILAEVAEVKAEPAGDDSALIASLQYLAAGGSRGAVTAAPGLSSLTAAPQPPSEAGLRPIGAIWRSLPYIVHDLGNRLGKSIELDMTGAGIELGREILELIKHPLVHMVRNAADHGIESPSERHAAGKPRKGRIALSASRRNGKLVMKVTDDGRGLSLENIRARAIESGVATEPEMNAMPDRQVERFIFEPGFSTVRAATAVSGRGVGLDVVRTNVERLGGSVELTSAPGQGTAFTIRIPLADGPADPAPRPLKRKRRTPVSTSLQRSAHQHRP